MNNNDSDASIGGKKGFSNYAYLSPLAVIALSFGYAVGWGAFVLPGAVFLPNAGPVGTIAGFLVLRRFLTGKKWEKTAKNGEKTGQTPHF